MDNKKVQAKRLSRSQATLLTSILYYREMASRRVVTFWSWFLQTVYCLNPYSLWRSEEFWKRCLLWYCAVRSRFTVDDTERAKLLEWANSKIKGVEKPTNFNTSWKNGVTLCALVESISPGSCPRYDLLNPEFYQSNVQLALEIAKKHLKMKPGITVKDMVECTPGSERKLICLLSQLKMTASLRPVGKKSVSEDGLPIIRTPGDGDRSFGSDRECVAKGMGLMLAVKGRKATFNIFLKTSTNLNIVIEIKGPNNTIASERITNRSPKRKTPLKQGTPVLEGSLLFRGGDIRHSISSSSVTSNDLDSEASVKIPFEYEVHQGKIAVGYIPCENGKHRLSIIWEGQHIIGSPYIVSVDDSMDNLSAAQIKSNKKMLTTNMLGDSLDFDAPPITPNNFLQASTAQGSQSERDSFPNYSKSSKKLGTVTRRRVLRHILNIDGKEIIVEDADAEHLGLAVQAMKEVAESERQISQQNSLDEDEVEYPDVVYRHVLCPVQEDTDLKDVRSPSPKKEVDCGPIFSDRPRAVSYTESEISSLDGIDTASTVNRDSFKWVEIPDVNHNLDTFVTKNKDIIPRLEITVSEFDDDCSTVSYRTPIPSPSLDVTVHSDEVDSITPEFAQIQDESNFTEPEKNNDISENYNQTYFHQIENAEHQSVSNGDGSESDEWLVISMDYKTKEHSVEISDERVKTPVREKHKDSELEKINIQPLNDLTEATCQLEEHEEYEPEKINKKPLIDLTEVTCQLEENEEYHSIEESHCPNGLVTLSTPCEIKDNLPPVAENSEVIDTVTDRKQFFENLFIQTNSKNSSPLHSPVKRSAASPSFSPGIKTMTTSYSVDESFHSTLKKRASREPFISSPKSQSLCSLSDDLVDTSPAFVKARDFWERSNASRSEPRVKKENTLISSNKNSAVEEVGSSIRKKLDFWQTLTSSKPTSPEHENAEANSREVTDGPSEAIDVVDKESRDRLSERLESPGSEGTRDSGVSISWAKTAVIELENPIVGGLDRNLSDPVTAENKKRALSLQDTNTLPLLKSFVYRHNPLFSLDTDSNWENSIDFGSQTEEFTGHNETMSDDRGYIDDEIPDYASLMMDRYISFTGLLDNDRLLSRNELVGLGIEELVGHCYGGESPCKDADKALLPKAGKCRAYGAGVYYGQVGIRNQFQVCTEGAGKGCLTVSVQGPGEHDVAEVVVSYMGEQSYEVMYEVLEPGYYIISVKWSEWNIPESPFICKVTY